MTENPSLREKRSSTLYYAAAVAIAIPGVLHLMLAPSDMRFNLGEGILFLVGGVAQIFWIIPIIRRWGRVWYSIGAAGNVAFFVIWLVTRFPGNPITGRGEMEVNTVELFTELAQIAFVCLAIAILAIDTRKSRHTRKEIAPGQTSLEYRNNRKKSLMILGGIVIALVLFSWFLLPSLMPRRGPGEGAREVRSDVGRTRGVPFGSAGQQVVPQTGSSGP